MRVNQQAAVVLHTRAYTESSLLVDVLTKEYGRLTLLSKGARRAKERTKKSTQPFQEYFISWVGKGELPILTQIEYKRQYTDLPYKSRVCAFYANELLTRTLQRFDPHPAIYQSYIDLLDQLSVASQRELALRHFEKTLLSEIGYALILDVDVESGGIIKASESYHYLRGRGPVLAKLNATESLGSGRSVNDDSEYPLVSGEVLLSLATSKYRNDDVMLAAKLFMRKMLAPLLGRKPLFSRDLLYPTL